MWCVVEFGRCRGAVGVGVGLLSVEVLTDWLRGYLSSLQVNISFKAEGDNTLHADEMTTVRIVREQKSTAEACNACCSARNRGVCGCIRIVIVGDVLRMG